MAKIPIFPVLISGLKLLLIVLKNALMDSYTFSIFYKLIHFALHLNLAIHRIDNAPNILCPRCNEQKKSLNPILYFMASFQNLL